MSSWLFRDSLNRISPGQGPSLNSLQYLTHSTEHTIGTGTGEVKGSYLSVDEGDADPVIVKQHAALGTVFVQLLVEQQKEEVSRGKEGRRGREQGSAAQSRPEAGPTLKCY